MQLLSECPGDFSDSGGDKTLDNRPDVVPDRFFSDHMVWLMQGNVPVSEANRYYMPEYFNEHG
jgi:hypothetical protein